MTKYEWLLAFHILGAFLLVSGAVVAGVLQLAAMGRERPSEVALLFRLSRVAVVMVGVGSLTVLAFGIWLAEDLNYGVGDEWVLASIALWVTSAALGGAGGRTYRQARELAEGLAAEGDRPSAELKRLVAGRPALLLNYASVAALVAILVLMVWKPGAG